MMSLAHMPPSLPVDDLGNRLPAHSKLACNSSMESPRCCEATDFPNSVFGQFSVAIPLPARIFVKLIVNGVETILLRSNPFQILDAVVRLVTIPVVDLRKSARVRDKGICYKSVDNLADRTTVKREGYADVTVGMGTYPKNSLSDIFVAPPAAPAKTLNGSDSPKARHLVEADETLNISPIFSHNHCKPASYLGPDNNWFHGLTQAEARVP